MNQNVLITQLQELLIMAKLISFILPALPPLSLSQDYFDLNFTLHNFKCKYFGMICFLKTGLRILN